MAQTACPSLDVERLTAPMIACARAYKEAEVAVAKPGAKVCRRVTTGIGVEDWIRGVVTEARAGKVGVKISDPGRIVHTVGGAEVKRGTVLWDDLLAWTPCL